VGVTVLDYTHLRFTLKQPAAFFPSTLTWPAARPMPAWAIAAHPTDWTEPAHIVTSGAYRLTAWAHGSAMTLEKSPGYFQAVGVHIERVSFSMLEDSAAWAAYRAGQLDSVVVPPAEWLAAASDPALAHQLHIASRYGTYYYGVNTSKAPFDRPLVRMAFAASVNRQGILDAITRYADQPALTFTPPGMWGHVDGPSAGVGIAYNPTLARQWLAAAGYPNGQGLPPITMMFDARSQFFDQNAAIASYLRRGWMDVLSATVAISHTEWANYLDLLQTDAPQIWQIRWLADHLDGYTFLGEGIDSFGRANYGNWYNPVFDGLLSLAVRTADLDTRAALYRQAEEILVETDAVMAPIYYFYNGIAARPYLARTYSRGGWGGRIADWRLTWQVFLPLILKSQQ
jgi:oligopeptide transport system substrate-binding protein